MCTVLPSNTLLLASQFSQQLATFDASTLTYTNFTPTNKADSNSEEGWTLLPNGTLLTVDTQNGTQSEIYTPLTQTWALAGSTQVTLPSAGGNSIVPEMGPQVLRPDVPYSLPALPKTLQFTIQPIILPGPKVRRFRSMAAITNLLPPMPRAQSCRMAMCSWPPVRSSTTQQNSLSLMEPT